MSRLIERIAGAYVHDNANFPVVQFIETLSTPVAIGNVNNLYGFSIYNPNAYTVYLKIFDWFTLPTLGTTEPKIIFAIPATSGKEKISFDLIISPELQLYAAVVEGYATTSGVPAAIPCPTTLFHK